MQSPVAPKGLRWREAGAFAAELRPKRSRFVFCVVGASWNLVFALGHRRVGGAWSSFDTVAFAAAVGFTVFAVREALLVVRIACDHGSLVVSGGAMAPWLRLGVPLSDVTEVRVTPNAGEGTYEVWVGIRSGAPVRLPVMLEGVPVTWNHGQRRLFPAPPSHAGFVAERVTKMVERGRAAQAGNPTEG